MVDKTKPDTENTLNWDKFDHRVNKKSKFDNRLVFWVSLENLELHFNP